MCHFFDEEDLQMLFVVAAKHECSNKLRDGQNIPRVFVNVITMFNISQGIYFSISHLTIIIVWNVSMTSDYCRFMWDEVVSGECGCLTDHTTEAQR